MAINVLPLGKVAVKAICVLSVKIKINRDFKSPITTKSAIFLSGC